MSATGLLAVGALVLCAGIMLMAFLRRERPKE